MTQTRLDERYNASIRSVWTSVLASTSRQWAGLKSWRGSDVAGFQKAALPILMAGERQVASLTATYLERLYSEIADETSHVDLDFDKVTGAALRNGVEPADVYERPFKEVWTALSKGEPLDVAVDRGANRLETLVKTDLQLARTHAAKEVLEQQPQVTYYLRTLNGEFDCALCLIASTQRYHKGNLLPIHPGCDCGVKTVKADEDPGQIVDEAKLDAIHAAVEKALGTHDRSGRAVDYRQIIIANDHGEIGPVLGFKGQKFTGPEDIKEPDHKPDPDPPTVKAAEAHVSDGTRQRLDEVRATLPKTREDWLDERRTLVVPASRPVDEMIPEQEAEISRLSDERARIVADAEADFKRRRVPKAKRADLLETQTRHVDNEIGLAEYRLNLYRELSSKPLDEVEPSHKYLVTERPAIYDFTYGRDTNGRLVPPEKYEQYLDQVLEIGHALRDDLYTSLTSDDELERRRAALAELKSAGTGASYDELRKARRAVAERESETIHALLRDVRSMGGQIAAKLGDYKALGSGSSNAPTDWQDQVDEAMRHFPSSWLAQMTGHELHVVGSDRAFYQTGSGGKPDVMALDSHQKVTYDGAFSSYSNEVATHEFGHRMEQYVAGLRELEYTLVRRRAMSNGVLDAPKNMASLSAAYKADDQEWAYEDMWGDPYTGKTYEAYSPNDPASMSSEVFQVGLQDLFGRGSRQFGGIELQAFVLAALALL